MATNKTTTARPIKLPVAPDRYDADDINRTRRMIEQALTQFGLGITALAVPTAVGPDAMKLYTPVSPIHGIARGLGSAVSSAFVQLSNPASSGKLVVIWRAAFNYESALTPAACAFRVTDAPSTVVPLVTATLQRMNGNDATAITSVLIGGNLATLAAEFPVLYAPWVINTPAKATGADVRMQQRELIPDGGQPIILLPGQALEGLNARKATDSDMQLYVEFDELALDTVIGAAQSEDGHTYPRSSIVGSCSTGGLALSSVSGALSVVQLYNPGPKMLEITGLYCLGNAVGVANPVMIRRTASPLLLGGTVVTLNPMRLDRRSTVAVSGVLKFSNNPGTVLFPGYFWQSRVGAADARLPWHTKKVSPFSKPLTIKPGSALEVAGLANVSSQNGYPLNVLIFWDEVDQ